MIFVTVGTHEQQFDRLIRAVDEIGKSEVVVAQIGYGLYEPKNCKYSRMLSYDDMLMNVQNADVIITHGGPGSIMLALESGITPIAVPRLEKFGEHVNNHQLRFCQHLQEQGNCLLVENIADLYDAIKVAYMANNLEHYPLADRRKSFVFNFRELADSLVFNR